VFETGTLWLGAPAIFLFEFGKTHLKQRTPFLKAQRRKRFIVLEVFRQLAKKNKPLKVHLTQTPKKR
jgi:hypothetical protein